jgi:hypothetical protein
VAVAVTGDARRFLRIAARPLRPVDIARAVEHLVELGFEHGLQEFAGAIPKASFNRVEPVVEKLHRSFGFRLRWVRHRAMACHGVISAGSRRNRLLHQAGDYAAFNFQPLPLRRQRVAAPRLFSESVCIRR